MFNRKAKRIEELEKENKELQNDLLCKKLDESTYAAIFGYIIENQVIEIVKNKVSPFLEAKLFETRTYKDKEETRLAELSAITEKKTEDILNIEYVSREINRSREKISYLERIQRDIMQITLNNLK